MNIYRRDVLRWAAAGATAAASGFPPLFAAGKGAEQSIATNKPVFDLLKTWCDRLLKLQIVDRQDSASYGGIRCPACGFLHGGSAETAYPLLCVAQATGRRQYVDAAVQVQAWSDNLSQPDGSWIGEHTDRWKGITVFRVIALAMSLKYHGALLDAATRERWRDRLCRAMKFLDGYLTISTGNINYPVTGALSYTLAGQLLDNRRWIQRGRQLARESLKYFTAHHLLFGEGKPAAASPKGYWPVDLGYNVEESLPSLAMYAILSDDREVLERVIAAMRTHLEFMLPDGAWDNSWGTRNFKWSWWGSRTSDGCQPGYLLLAGHDPRFREVAWRNFELLAACTHDGLLYGGPDYYRCGYPACTAHTMMHAKALATILDCATTGMKPSPRLALPRDAAYGLRHFDDIGTTLVAVGEWRATVTDSDWQYRDVSGGHASGGALSMLYHHHLGPVLVASMTEYQREEPNNQQRHRDGATMPLTPRIECRLGAAAYTNLSDYGAVVVPEQCAGGVVVKAHGRLCDIHHQSPATGDVLFQLAYHFTAGSVRIAASVVGPGAAAQLILPVVCSREETAARIDAQTVRIVKPTGALRIHTNAAAGLAMTAGRRVFNLVPGFECLPLSVVLPRGAADTSVEIHVEGQ